MPDQRGVRLRRGEPGGARVVELPLDVVVAAGRGEDDGSPPATARASASSVAVSQACRARTTSTSPPGSAASIVPDGELEPGQAELAGESGVPRDELGPDVDAEGAHAAPAAGR